MTKQDSIESYSPPQSSARLFGLSLDLTAQEALLGGFALAGASVLRPDLFMCVTVVFIYFRNGLLNGCALPVPLSSVAVHLLTLRGRTFQPSVRSARCVR